jgi:WD40 repeat protein
MSDISTKIKEDFNSIMISSNCNALLNACDYSDEFKCLAFVSSNLIHIYDTNKVKTFLTLKEHNQRANSVRWIKSNNCAELLSCSSEGNICHWVNPSGKVFDYKSWSLKEKYSDKENSTSNSGINFLNSLYISENEKYFYTFATNGDLNLWGFTANNDKYEIYAKINYKKKLQDALALMLLDDDYLLLLSGGYDNLINVHIIKRKNSNFTQINNINNLVDIEYKLSLQGHNNSIRDIQIAPNLNSNNNNNITNNTERLFASSSQDSYIRLWSISKISKEEIDKLIENMETKKNNTIYEEYKNKMSYLFRTKDQDYYNIVLDSVLGGHEESVSSIRWGNIDNKNVLLSSSFDFTLGIWKLDEQMVNKYILILFLFYYIYLTYIYFYNSFNFRIYGIEI